LLRALLASRGTIQTPLGRGWRRELEVIRATRELAPLLLNDAAALHIQTCVRAVRGLGGEMAEAGVLMGGSARLICEAKGEAVLHLFDAFDTLQSPAHGQADAAEAELRSHFGAVHGRRKAVESLLSPYPGVQLHAGVFPATTAGLEATRFSLVHLDMDLASSTRAGLEFFQPRMVPSGIMLGDDYDLAAVRDAFADHFAGLADTVIPLPWGQVMVVRQG
jgi:hypothetical protein